MRLVKVGQCSGLSPSIVKLLSQPQVGVETGVYVCQTHDRFHTGIKHSIRRWNRIFARSQLTSIEQRYNKAMF